MIWKRWWIGRKYQKKCKRNWIGRSNRLVSALKLTAMKPLHIFRVQIPCSWRLSSDVVSELDLEYKKITAAEQKLAVDTPSRKHQKNQKLNRTRLARRRKNQVFTGALRLITVAVKNTIWIITYVLASYGTGAIMAVPCPWWTELWICENIDTNHSLYFRKAAMLKKALHRWPDHTLSIRILDEWQNRCHWSNMVCQFGKNMAVGKKRNQLPNPKLTQHFSHQRYWGRLQFGHSLGRWRQLVWCLIMGTLWSTKTANIKPTEQVNLIDNATEDGVNVGWIKLPVKRSSWNQYDTRNGRLMVLLPASSIPTTKALADW